MTNKLWVHNDYINELTVLFAWCIALIPWNIQYTTLDGLGQLVFVRFPFFQIRYQLGFEVGEQNLILSPYGAYTYQTGNPMADPYLWWTLGAAPLAIAFTFACGMYLLDLNRSPLSLETLQHKLPIPFSRLIGGLIATGTIGLLIATYYLFTTGFQGINIPLGIIFFATFSYILLTNPLLEQ